MTGPRPVDNVSIVHSGQPPIHPNHLTIFRMAAAPVLVILLYIPGRAAALGAALLFSLAAASDWIDGYLARRYGLITVFGRAMDPVADKLLTAGVLIMLSWLHRVPAWMACAIIGREILITGLRTIMAERKQDESASRLGKYKTGFQVSALIPLLVHYPVAGVNLHAVGLALLWLALGLTLWSGIDYVRRFARA